MMVSKLLAATVIASLSLAPAAFATGLWNDTVPGVSGNSIGASPNSLPPGFENGTVQGNQAQSLDRWYAGQGYHRFASNRIVGPVD
jgi:hypothetical protein